MHHHKWSWDVNGCNTGLGQIGFMNHARNLVYVCELVLLMSTHIAPTWKCARKIPPLFFFHGLKFWCNLVSFSLYVLILFRFAILFMDIICFTKWWNWFMRGSNTPILRSSKCMWHMKYASITKLWLISTFESQKCQMCVFKKWH